MLYKALPLAFTATLVLAASAANSVMAFDKRAEDTLLVWAGDQARKAPDFVAVIDFDRDSPRYGKVLRTVPLPPLLRSPREPHHLGVSHDGRTLALGGLLSIMTDGNEVFFFDISDRRHPAFIKPNNPPNAPISDDFDALSTGGFLAWAGPTALIRAASSNEPNDRHEATSKCPHGCGTIFLR